MYRVRHPTSMTDTGDDVSHPVSIYDELPQAILGLDFERDSDVQWDAERASSPAPQREDVERSISARGVPECWSHTHRSESWEGIILHPTDPVVDNTRSAVLDIFADRSHIVLTCGDDHLCSL